MGRVPARCILLLEDLDAAFTRSVSRDGSSNGLPHSAKKDTSTDMVATVQNHPNNTSGANGKEGKDGEDGSANVNTLSLSGLLNSLDGVAAAEGRILFACVALAFPLSFQLTLARSGRPITSIA